MPRIVRIGAGAGFADDRIEPAVDLVERGELDFLVFECLAERTIALRQLERRRDPRRRLRSRAPRADDRGAGGLPRAASAS